MIVGALAESFSISDDGTTYTFNLAEGVKWHDGEAFDGDDVVATFTMLADPDYSGGIDRVGQIVGVDAFKEDRSKGISGITLSADKMTVTITIKAPSATFPSRALFSDPSRALHQKLQPRRA